MRFHEILRAAGRLPTKDILALETRTAGSEEAKMLSLPQAGMVHVYEGISRADGHPVALARTVFPADRFPDLPEALAKHRSITRAWTRCTAKRASATQALHLQIGEGAPLLRTVSLSQDADGQPVEFGQTWFAGDRVTLTVGEE